jgi:hypothetical protein
MGGNNKLSKAKDLIDELGTDIVAYNKHRQNLRHIDNHNGWNQLFKGGEADVCSVVAHNVHEAEHGGQDDSILSAKLIRIAPENSSF